VRAEWERGLAASLLAARESVQEPFVLAMADHVFDDAVIGTVRAAKARGVSMLVDTKPRPDVDLDTAVRVHVDYGVVGRIGQGLEGYNGVDAGLFHATPELFDALDEALRTRDGHVDLSHGLQLLAAKNQVHAIEVSGFWL